MVVLPRASNGPLVAVPYVKSSLAGDGSLYNQQHATLVGSARLACTPDPGPALSGDIDKLCDVQWRTVPIPASYLHVRIWEFLAWFCLPCSNFF